MKIAKLVSEYISRHPSVLDGLKHDILNYSKLSRMIIDDLSLKQSDFDAVLVALRRSAYEMADKKTHESEITSLLAKSKLEVKNKISVVHLEKDVMIASLSDLQKDVKRQKGFINTIEGNRTITVITNDEFMDKIKKDFKGKIVKAMKGLVLIHLINSENIEETPGLISYLTTILASNSINILEMMSCWTDTMFVIAEKDLGTAMEALKF